MKPDTSRSSDASASPGVEHAELVRKIRAGDRRAEEELVERFSRGLALMLRRLARDPTLAEDLHQETLTLVLVKVRGGELREPEKLAGFIRSTAHNLFIADRRKASRIKVLGDEDEALGEAVHRGSESQLRQALRNEKVDLVRKLLGELRHDRDRELLTRFYLLDDTKAEICRDLAIDPKRFNRVLFRARQRLKVLWERTAKRQRIYSRGKAK